MSFIGILKSGPERAWAQALNPKQAAVAFAGDLSGRIAASSGLRAAENGSAPTAELNARLDRLGKLESALSGTVGYMAEKHGDRAASAMMAIIYKSLGNAEITEASLGEAFLDAARFVDKNFGIEAGDAFMAHLNKNLNDGLNEFFENGKTELFMAVTNGKPSPSSLVRTSGEQPGAGERYADAILDLLKSARVEQRETGVSHPYAPYAEANQRQSALGALYDGVI